MNESLIGGGEQGNSSSSAPSSSHSSIASESLEKSSSLLERIRQQREREMTSSYTGVSQDIESSDPLVVPSYAQDAVGSNSEMMVEQPAWGSSSMMGLGGGMSLNFDNLFRGGGGGDATQGLLSQDGEYGQVSDENYSVKAYFRMFLRDIYKGFVSAPPLLKAVICGLLLWFLVWLF